MLRAGLHHAVISTAYSGLLYEDTHTSPSKFLNILTHLVVM